MINMKVNVNSYYIFFTHLLYTQTFGMFRPTACDKHSCVTCSTKYGFLDPLTRKKNGLVHKVEFGEEAHALQLV